MMGEFDWVEEQCEYTQWEVEYIQGVCRYFGHRTIQDYVNKLKQINNRNIERINEIPTSQKKRIQYYEDKVKMLSGRIPKIQLMANTYTESVYKKD
jgi:hypothetical protein